MTNDDDEALIGPDEWVVAEASRLIDRIQGRIRSDYYMRLAHRIARLALPKPGPLARLLRLRTKPEVRLLATRLGVQSARTVMLQDELAAHIGLRGTRGELAAAREGLAGVVGGNRALERRVIQLQEALLTGLMEKPKKSGALNRQGRWGWRDKARDRAIELWEAGGWESKRHCAGKITPEIEALVVSLGNRLSRDNAEDTVYGWLLDYKPETPTDEANPV